LREKILYTAHDSPFAGNHGFYKTYKVIRERFTWWGLKEDVQRHVRECDSFQRNKGGHTHSVGMLQSLPIAER